LSSLADEINPAGIYSYLDLIQVWLKIPVSIAGLAWFRNQCQHLHVHRGYAPFGRGYRQRLQLKQPNKPAVEKLLGCEDVLVNRVEVSLDWTFSDSESLENATYFVCSYLVKKYHRREHGINFYNGTRYTAPWHVPTKIVNYDSKPCRITGEIHCLHFDYRLRNSDAVRRNGIRCVAELLELDHHLFWKKRLVMRAVDLVHLGKLHRAHFEGKRRRTEWIQYFGQFPYYIDRRRGSIVMRACGSTQALLDEYRDRFEVTRCLREIDVEHLLPTPKDVYN
jgi:hypothetical protein